MIEGPRQNAEFDEIGLDWIRSQESAEGTWMSGGEEDVTHLQLRRHGFAVPIRAEWSCRLGDSAGGGRNK